MDPRTLVVATAVGFKSSVSGETDINGSRRLILNLEAESCKPAVHPRFPSPYKNDFDSRLYVFLVLKLENSRNDHDR